MPHAFMFIVRCMDMVIIVFGGGGERYFAPPPPAKFAVF